MGREGVATRGWREIGEGLGWGGVSGTGPATGTVPKIPLPQVSDKGDKATHSIEEKEEEEKQQQKEQTEREKQVAGETIKNNNI